MFYFSKEKSPILCGLWRFANAYFISNMGGIRIYEAVIFRIVKIENMNDEDAAAAIVKDTEDLIRKQTHLVFEEAKKTGEFTRDVARRLFTPDKSDTPDM